MWYKTGLNTQEKEWGQLNTGETSEVIRVKAGRKERREGKTAKYIQNKQKKIYTVVKS